MNRLKLLFEIIIKFGFGFLIMGIILFLCAGSLYYVNGWIFLISLAIPMFLFGLYLLIKDIETLKRRLESKEPIKSQQINIWTSAIMFILVFIISGLDYRLKWSNVGKTFVFLAIGIMWLGYLIFVTAILQNSYASRIVDIHEGQKIVTEGIYGIVRHPMYLATLLIFFPIPIILGSWIAVFPMCIYPFIIVNRIKGEELLLNENLKGYKEYTEKVKYRMIPFLW